MLTSPQYFAVILYIIRNVHILPITLVNVLANPILKILAITYSIMTAFQGQSTFRIDEMSKKRVIKIFGRKSTNFDLRKVIEYFPKNGKISGYGFFVPPKPRARTPPMVATVTSIIG